MEGRAALDIQRVSGANSRVANERRSAGVVIRLNGGVVALHRRDHTASRNAGLLGVFGGRSDDGEDVVMCAVREIQEELGLSIVAAELSEIGTFLVRYMDCVVRTTVFSLAVDDVTLNNTPLNEGAGIEQLLLHDTLPEDLTLVAHEALLVMRSAQSE